MRIYFICTGNTCRSPMAAAILKSRNLPGVEVKSAGIYAISGQPMSANAQAALQKHHIDHDHISQPVNIEELQSSHLILTMTCGHKEALLQVYPQMADKTFTLKEYVLDRDEDVIDPFGGDLDTYLTTFEELNNLIDVLEKKLLEE